LLTKVKKSSYVKLHLTQIGNTLMSRLLAMAV